MKKAKIVLSAVALFAVVGGALAFKATRANHPFFKTDAVGVCTVPVVTTYTTNRALALPNAPAIEQTTYNTTTSAGPCTLLTIYSAS